MNKFVSGLMAGSVIGIAGLTYAMSDRRTRKRLTRDSRRVIDKATDVVDSITDRF